MAGRLILPDTAFGTDRRQFRQPRVKDGDYAAWLHENEIPCVVSGMHVDIECAHIRFSSVRHGKRATGMQERPSDCWQVPLIAGLHRLWSESQHNSNEREWWKAHNIDPLVVAALLYAHFRTDDAEGAVYVAKAATAHFFPWNG